MPGVDAEYFVGAAKIKEQLVLKSDAAPRSFVFEIADPRHLLGDVKRDLDGGSTFSNPVGDGLTLALDAPRAWEQGSGESVGSAGEVSAHQSVERTAKGYRVSLSLDEEWLAGKSFPVVLDPTLEYSWQQETVSAAWAAVGDDACDGDPCPLASSWDGSAYLGGLPEDQWRSAGYYHMDLSSIPASTPIVSAAFYLGYEASANPEATFPESSTVGVATLDELLEPGDSWSDLSPGGYAGIETTFGPADGVSEGPEEQIHERHRADVTASVRHWLDTANGANAGFQVTLEPEGAGQVFNPTLVIEYTGRALPPPIPVEQTWGCSCEFGHGPDRVTHEADPVNTADGGLMESEVDLSVAAPGVPVNLRRTYNGSDTTDGAMGVGWAHAFETTLSEDAVSGAVEFRDPTGGQVRFLKQTDGSYLGDTGVTGTLTASTGGGWTLTSLANEQLVFNADGRLTSNLDAAGHGLTIAYTGTGTATRVATVTDAAGNATTMSYGSSGAATGKLVTVTTHDGRDVDYGYTTVNGAARLTRVTAPDGKVSTLSYDSTTGKLDGLTTPGSHTSAQNVYDPTTGRITEQTDARGNVWEFDWEPSTDPGAPPGTGVQTTTDPLEHDSVTHYYGNVMTKHVDAHGKTTDYYYDDALNLVAVKDPRGYVTTMTYDAAGNMLTRAAAEPVDSAEIWTYDTNNNVETHRDGANDWTTYAYNTANQLISVTNDLNETTSYTYTPAGLLESVETAEGRTTEYDYNTEGHLIAETSPSGRVTTYGRDDAGRMTSTTDPRGNLVGATAETYTTHYTYDDNGRVLTLTDAKDTLTTNTYDDDGNLSRRTITNPATTPVTVLADTTYTYDADGRQLTATDYDGTADERTTATNVYDELGRLTQSTDAEGATTSYTYDALGRQLTMTTPRGNAPGATAADYTWTFAYDENGNQTSASDPQANITYTRYDALNQPVLVRSPNGYDTKTEYDGAGHVRRSIDPMGRQSTWTYDAAGRTVQTHVPATGNTYFGYDHDGNKVSEESASGDTHTTWTYTPDGQEHTMVAPNGNVTGGVPADYTTTYTYDAAGNMTSQSDPLDHVTSWTYDALDNKVSQTFPNASQTINWTYDRLGRLTKVAPPGSVGGDTTYTYDKHGDMVTREDGEHHTTTYEYDARHQVTKVTDPLTRQRTFAYDAESNLVSWVTARGHATGATASDWTVEQTFDPRGLLTARTTSETGVNTGSSVTMDYDPDGRLVNLADATETTQLGYYEDDQLSYVFRSTDGGYYYDYDQQGRLSEVTNPTSSSTNYTYNTDGLPATLAEGGRTTSFEYDANHALTAINHPTAVGLVETRNHDQAGRLSSIRNKKNGAANALSKFIYTRDPNGNVLRIQTTRGTTVTNEAFTYSLKNWLGKYCPGVTSCTGASNYVSYGYSGTGNRLTEQRVGAVPNPGTTTNTYNAADELTKKVVTPTGGSPATTNYTYTADGQLASDGRTWNVLGQLTAANINGPTNYTYDGLGDRRSATTSAGTTKFSWDINNPMHMLAVTTDPNNDTSTHRYTPTGDILGSKHSAAVYDRSYYGHDAMGSVTDTLKGDGTPTWKHTYEPFGATTSSTALVTGAVDTNFGYTSAYQEPALGAEYALRARDYNPTNGRFNSVDPLTPAPTDPAISPYLYVNNQPTVLVDPTGLSGCEPGGTPDPWCALSRWLDEGVDAAEPAFEFAREVSGVNDAEDCLLHGDVSSCLWTTANVVPISRLGKAGKAIAEVCETAADARKVAPAANSVRTAAPSTFTRAEALSGRASSRNVDEIAASMRANGWQGAPIDVVELQGQRIVVDGHHRLAAARRAGMDVQYRTVDPSTVIGPGRYTSIDDILQSTYSVGRDRLR